MRLGDLWAKHGVGSLQPDSAETNDLFIFGVTDDSREVRFGYRKQVLSGTTGAALVRNAGPRRDALELALSALHSGDVLVVAGKGHEDYQIVLAQDSAGRPLQDARGRPVTKKIPFSDTRVIREIAQLI